jgi:thioredoxin-like negative regulator of GroEL
MRRAYHNLGWSYVAFCGFVVARTVLAKPAPSHASGPLPLASASADAAEWFRRAKPYCNAVEITVLQRQVSPPATLAGAGFHAACFALAGKVDDARRIIDALPATDRHRAAGIVFDVGHPVADAGDDRSAAPIMEMVIDYWPNHYMALYHAAMAEYMLGQRDLARRNLTEFLRLYSENDGWRSNGIEVLRRLNDSTGRQAEFKRPREPGS